MRRSVDPSKKYQIPEWVSYVRLEDRILTIAVETARWIVLENENQKAFFELLRAHCLSEALERFEGDRRDAVAVVTQLEARQFDLQNPESCIREDIHTLHLYVTNACNMRCPHCYMHSGHAEKEELSLGEIQQLLSEFKEYGGTGVTLSGGEATLRPDFPEIVQHAFRVGLPVRVLTNGTLLTEQLLDKVGGMLDSVQVSLDGFSEESNAKVRGVGNFAKALDCVHRLIARGIRTSIGVTPFPDGDLAANVERYAAFARGLSAQYTPDQLKIKFAEEVIEGRAVNPTDTSPESTYAKHIHDIYTAYHGRDTSHLAFVQAFEQPIIMDNCMYGALTVSATGDVYFCAQIGSAVSPMSIRTHRFGEVIRLASLAQEKANIRGLRPCNQCDLMYICGGGCRITHFPELVKAKDLENLDVSTIAPRQCSQGHKEFFYRLMVENNAQLFR